MEFPLSWQDWRKLLTIWTNNYCDTYDSTIKKAVSDMWKPHSKALFLEAYTFINIFIRIDKEIQ